MSALAASRNLRITALPSTASHDRSPAAGCAAAAVRPRPGRESSATPRGLSARRSSSPGAIGFCRRRAPARVPARAPVQLRPARGRRRRFGRLGARARGGAAGAACVRRRPRRSSSAATRRRGRRATDLRPASTKRSSAVSSSRRALPPARASASASVKSAQRAHDRRLRHGLARARVARCGVLGREIAREQRRVDARHQQVAELGDQRANQYLHVGAGVAGVFDGRAAPPQRRARAIASSSWRAKSRPVAPKAASSVAQSTARRRANAAACSSIVSASRNPPSAR